MAEDLRRSDEATAMQKLQKRQTILPIQGRRAKVFEQPRRQPLKTRGRTALPWSPPGVANGYAPRSRRIVRVRQRMAPLIHWQPLGLRDFPLPVGLGDIIRTSGIPRMVPHHLPREHAPHPQLIQKAPAKMRQLRGIDPPSGTKRLASVPRLLLQTIVGHGKNPQIDQRPAKERGDRDFVQQGRLLPRSNAQPFVLR
jgi:hypothetical protein